MAVLPVVTASVWPRTSACPLYGDHRRPSVALPGLGPGADAARQVRRHNPVSQTAAARGHQAPQPGDLPAPASNAAASPLRQIAGALGHAQSPDAGGHVSRPRRAGHLLLGNLRDISRNCQHDVSRNYRLGGLTAPAASAILSKGLGRRISASRRPAWARQAGSPVTLPGGGARMPTASGLPVARRDALVQARRAATSTSSSLCCDDDQDAVGERPPGRTGNGRLTAGEGA